MLAIDVSDSMAAGGKFEAAKGAAQIFLDSVPDDLYVGMVTFAGDVTVAQEPTPTRRRRRSRRRPGDVARHPAVRRRARAVNTAGDDGTRSVLVLSDGRGRLDDTPTRRVTAHRRGRRDEGRRRRPRPGPRRHRIAPALADAGDGQRDQRRRPRGARAGVRRRGQTLAKQIQITSRHRPTAGREGNLAVTVEAGGETYTDAAFVTHPGSDEAPAAASDSGPAPVDPGYLVSNGRMYGGIASAASARAV